MRNAVLLLLLFKKLPLFVAHFKKRKRVVWVATATAQTSEIASFALQNGLWMGLLLV